MLHKIVSLSIFTVSKSSSKMPKYDLSDKMRFDMAGLFCAPGSSWTATRSVLWKKCRRERGTGTLMWSPSAADFQIRFYLPNLLCCFSETISRTVNSRSFRVFFPVFRNFLTFPNFYNIFTSIQHP